MRSPVTEERRANAGNNESRSMTKNNYPLTRRTLDRNEVGQRSTKSRRTSWFLASRTRHGESACFVVSVLQKVAHLAMPSALLVQQPTRSGGAADCVSFWRRSSPQTILS